MALLREFQNLPLTEYEIADLAYLVERKDLGIRGGLQDQYAASFGGFNFLELFKDRVIVNPLRIRQDLMNELEHNLLLCYTNTTRHSDEIIQDQTQRYEHQNHCTVRALGQQKQLVIDMKNALLQRRLNDFGALLHDTWLAKKDMSPRISNSFVDELYEEAQKRGALGGKITGAGGGGFICSTVSSKRNIRLQRL